MKKNFFAYAAIIFAAQFIFIACDNDTDLVPNEVPESVMKAFNSMFTVSQVQWEKEGNQYKAEFWQNGKEVEAWFQKDGTWSRTEHDMNPTELPEPVSNYVSSNYPDYVIDDADYVETPASTYYELELEKNGKRDRIIRLTADGLAM